MVIDIIKLLLSKDTREAFTDAIKSLKKSPEWKEDMLNIEEKFLASEEEKARLLVKFFRKILVDKGWKEARSGVVEFAVQEIVNNAFIHGLPSSESKGFVRIQALLTNHLVDCQVSDTGQGFDLLQILKDQSNGESHGLTRVKEVTSSLTQNKKLNIISVTIKRKAGRVRSTKIDDVSTTKDVYVIKMDGDFDQDSGEVGFPKIRAVPYGANLIIDLTDVTYLASDGLHFMTWLYLEKNKNGSKVVYLFQADSALLEIFESTRIAPVLTYATSLSEAKKILNS